MKDYTLFYNYFETPKDFSNSEIIISIALIIAIIYVITKVKKQKKLTIIFLSAMCLFSIILTAITQFNHYNSFNLIKKLHNTGKLKTIEGKVTNYTPMKIEGHGSMETFFIDSVFFSYSDYLIIEGYNNSCVKGGLICHNGQEVKIEYIQTVRTEEQLSQYVSNILGHQIIKLYLRDN